MKKTVMPVLLVLLGCLVLLSSCSLAGGGDEKKVTAYFKAVGPDFEKSKEDLNVFDQDFSENEDSIAEMLSLAAKGKRDFQTRMDNVKRQEVPGSPKELTGFHNSLIKYYSDCIKLMSGLEQMLKYSQDMLKSITPLENMGNMEVGDASSMEEVGDAVMSLKDSITESITIAEKCTPPQYMTDSHANYVNTLKKYGSATDDFIYALQIADPLRVNATTYRYQLLSNKLIYVGQEMNKDIELQTQEIKTLGENLQKDQDELNKQLLIYQGKYNSAN